MENNGERPRAFTPSIVSTYGGAPLLPDFASVVSDVRRVRPSTAPSHALPSVSGAMIRKRSDSPVFSGVDSLVPILCIPVIGKFNPLSEQTQLRPPARVKMTQTRDL